jgi:hypothetical protein
VRYGVELLHRAQVYAPEGIGLTVDQLEVVWSAQGLSLEQHATTSEDGWHLTVDALTLAGATNTNLIFGATLLDITTGAAVTRIQRAVQLDTPPTCSAPVNDCLSVRALLTLLCAHVTSPSTDPENARRFLFHNRTTANISLLNLIIFKS